MRLNAPAADRNVGPILDVLKRFVPLRGRVLEVASGTGQHVAAFAKAFPEVEWQPSDVDPEARDSIAAWREFANASNILPPLDMDVAAPRWEDRAGGPFDGMIAINLLHISEWSTCPGLFRGAAECVVDGGFACLYGPFKRGGAHTAPSNEAFDGSLRRNDPSWGVRDLEDVVEVAAKHGFRHEATVEMPANNLTVVFIHEA